MKTIAIVSLLHKYCSSESDKRRLAKANLNLKKDIFYNYYSGHEDNIASLQQLAQELRMETEKIMGERARIKDMISNKGWLAISLFSFRFHHG